MSIFNDTITVYNRYVNEDYGDEYYPTVINNVCFQVMISGIDNSVDSTPNNHALILIDKRNLNAKYMKPKAWTREYNKSNYFTLKSDDIIVRGEVIVEDATSDYLTDNYDDVFKIYSVSDFDLIPHFEVLAK